LILTNPSVQQVRAQSRKEEAKSMFEDGVEKVKNGITTMEELIRVALPPTAKQFKE
jgi:type II secretory ATPase GspE/PulE/Tfp pilus assembly ATPase PilB-like protein